MVVILLFLFLTSATYGPPDNIEIALAPLADEDLVRHVVERSVAGESKLSSTLLLIYKLQPQIRILDLYAKKCAIEVCPEKKRNLEINPVADLKTSMGRHFTVDMRKSIGELKYSIETYEAEFLTNLKSGIQKNLASGLTFDEKLMAMYQLAGIGDNNRQFMAENDTLNQTLNTFKKYFGELFFPVIKELDKKNYVKLVNDLAAEVKNVKASDAVKELLNVDLILLTEKSEILKESQDFSFRKRFVSDAASLTVIIHILNKKTELSFLNFDLPPLQMLVPTVLEEIDLRKIQSHKSIDLGLKECVINFNRVLDSWPNEIQWEQIKRNFVNLKSRVKKEFVETVAEKSDQEKLTNILDNTLLEPLPNSKSVQNIFRSNLKMMAYLSNSFLSEKAIYVKSYQTSYFLKNSGQSFSASFCTSQYLAKGADQLDWQKASGIISITEHRNEQENEAIMMHEIFHLFDPKVTDTEFSESYHGQLRKVFSCLNQFHPTENKHTAEDWADAGSNAMGLSEGLLNFNCKYFEEASIQYSQGWVGNEEHSSQLFRALHSYKYLKGTLPKSCTQYLEMVSPEVKIQECLKLQSRSTE